MPKFSIKNANGEVINVIVAADIASAANLAPSGGSAAEVAQAYTLEDKMAERSRERMLLSFSQLLIGLHAMKWVTETEAEEWLARNALPSEVISIIDGLPADQRFPARAKALGMVEARRLNPLVLALAAARGISDSDMDTFFMTFAEG